MGALYSSVSAQNGENHEFNDDVDWEALEGELLKFMKRPGHDDGTLGPLFLRLAWHSSGTYDARTKTGGSNGATMRYAVEANDPENAGLGLARDLLEKIKEKYPSISYADLWIFASYVFLRASGGPDIPFCPGRIDAAEDKAIAPGRLPEAEYGVCPAGGVDAQGRVNGWQNTARHVREVFYRQGFNDKDIVALLCGGHVYGRCHIESSGYNGPWVVEPWKFSNEYAADMVNDKWVVVDNKNVPEDLDDPDSVRPVEGKSQYAGYAASESSEEEEDNITWEDLAELPVGKYMVNTAWVNIREGIEKNSSIIGRANRGETFFIIATAIDGKTVFGRISCGGWVKLCGSGRVLLFKRISDLALPTPMTIRIIDPEFDVYKKNHFGIMSQAEEEKGVEDEELIIREVIVDGKNHYGKLPGNDDLYLRLVSPEQKVFFERISKGWNDEPRSIKFPDVKTQMMLVSDMILLWDEDFKKYLEVYAEDEDALRRDFGSAFKRLTENGFREFPEPVELVNCSRRQCDL